MSMVENNGIRHFGQDMSPLMLPRHSCYCKFIIDTTSALAQKDKKCHFFAFLEWVEVELIQWCGYRLVQTLNNGVPLPTHEPNDPVPPNMKHELFH